MVLQGPCTRDTPHGGRERGATGAFVSRCRNTADTCSVRDAFFIQPLSLHAGLSMSCGTRLSLFNVSDIGGMLMLHMASSGCSGDARGVRNPK